MPQAETQAAQTFYSKTGGLTFWTRKPKWIPDADGRNHVDEGPMVQFIAQSDGFGRYTTDDPELIAALQARMANEKDVISQAEYLQAIQPAEKKIEDRDRRIESQNRLINDMQAKIAELSKGGQPSPARR